ncbi:phytoene dehydrogenase-like protein [Arthrobacter pigmenti]|uniref:Pyridine nucleotide-disulfide oxidoreductase domain-containing protein 2 n=1 Tax=Arthrobacter pigmenti TaxID=271432 RepID=A0A846RZN2_9MICC|nr:NAD(P)/FAD-dependent oxidoreductase [Arthrobacter pigmenti]NJC23641.1 phytoene dehydrogenase-like protein [Arthrobacter pigmenti]
MTQRYDAIVVGGGHNGLVAASYLARAGESVLVLEARDIVGGPAGAFEFLPGYRTSFANSPGSFERRVLTDLELHKYGLEFIRPDPTLVHAFPSNPFIGYRDRRLVHDQLNRFVPGEADRYQELLASLEELGRQLGVSLFSPSPTIEALDERMANSGHASLYQRVFHGSLADLLDESLKSTEAKALLGMIALNGNMLPPTQSGSAVGLMLRPISMASGSDFEVTASPLRGSSGLPVGGIGAIVDAIAAGLRAHGGEIICSAPVTRILHDGDRVSGVVTESGDEYIAPVVISAIDPQLTGSLLVDDPTPTSDLLSEEADSGSAFKIVLALDGQPEYADLPDGLSTAQACAAQFRIAPSFEYIEQSISDGLAGRPTSSPIIWGLLLSETSPHLAPKGRGLLSINAWHAPYELAEGEWDESRTETFGQVCIDQVSTLMPRIRDYIIDHRFMSPVEVESITRLPKANITHGDMTLESLFGNRPNRGLHDYRTWLRGLYLGCAGSWPGGYFTGVPGFGASHAVLADKVSARPLRVGADDVD